jgi:hypothetical protein
MDKKAIFSCDRSHRYALFRDWNSGLSKVMFVALNPSTADEFKDDPTIRRCIGYAKDWGFSGLIVTNLFAYRATKPEDLKKSNDPIGVDNDLWLKRLAEEVDLIIGAWGNHGTFMNRNIEVEKLFMNIHCLGLNKTGCPVHPLYQPKHLQPMPMDHT